MVVGRRVLVTGLAGDIAGLVAARLERDDRVATIVGVDRREPRQLLERTEFVRADASGGEVAHLLAARRIDTVVHLAITAEPGLAGGRQRMKEHNVIRTMRLLGAVDKAPAVERLIVKSTTAVYGSSHADPALLREDVAPGAGGSGYASDAVEVESYARNLARRRSDLRLSVLRFANFIGPGVDSLIGRYLALPVVPTVLGYDPRVQLCHVDDAVEVVHRAVIGDHPGIYNVAGPGVVYLSQLVRLAGRVAVGVPAPLVDPVAGTVRRLRALDFSPEQLQFLFYGRVGDITRLREDLGYEPRYRTREAVEDFVAGRQVQPLIHRDAVERVEERLAGMVHALAEATTRGRPAPGQPAGVQAGQRP